MTMTRDDLTDHLDALNRTPGHTVAERTQMQLAWIDEYARHVLEQAATEPPQLPRRRTR
jgi:hypothetical protein